MEAGSSLVISEGKQGMPSFPSNITREDPHSLPIVQGAMAHVEPDRTTPDLGTATMCRHCGQSARERKAESRKLRMPSCACSLPSIISISVAAAFQAVGALLNPLPHVGPIFCFAKRKENKRKGRWLPVGGFRLRTMAHAHFQVESLQVAAGNL